MLVGHGSFAVNSSCVTLQFAYDYPEQAKRFAEALNHVFHFDDDYYKTVEQFDFVPEVLQEREVIPIIKSS